MYKVTNQEFSSEFAQCWNAAARHLQQQGQGSLNWLRANLDSPFLEHLSFRIGNQLVFVRVVDADESIDIPSTMEALFRIATACKGHACLMPMSKKSGEWRCVVPGWGLIDAGTDKWVNPVDLISEDLVEMTDWELHDFAVQVVRDKLKADGRKLISWQSDPEVNPSIWFEGANGAEWVIVKESRWPEDKPTLPKNVEEIAEMCRPMGKIGNFAAVAVASANDPFDSTAKTSGNFVQLNRSEGLCASYDGLQPLSLKQRETFLPTHLSAQLINEFLSWFESNLEKDILLPRMFSGVNQDGMQYLVEMSRTGLDFGEHLDFMRYVMWKEQSIGFAFNKRVGVLLSREPEIVQEQHEFYSGTKDSFHIICVASKNGEDWKDGLNVVHHSNSETPEVFFQELLPELYKPTAKEAEYAAIWQSIRSQAHWRSRI